MSHESSSRRGDVEPGGSSCVFCGALAAQCFTREPQTYRVVVCENCGLGRTLPMPSRAETAALYAGDYADASARKFGGPLEWARRRFGERLADRILARAGRGGRVLDIGCGDGKLLLALARRGFECVGTDLNPRLRETVSPESGEVYVGEFEDAHFPSASFRVVVVRHVLEHLRDPPAALREIRRVLADDGVLVLAVPNLASWQGRLMRDHWFHLDLPRHLYHFTPASLAAMLESSGFALDRISHFSLEQNPYGWLQSLFSAAGGRWHHLYDGVLRAPGSAHARERDPLVAFAAALMVPLCAALATIESACRRGGTIEVWARPR